MRFEFIGFPFCFISLYFRPFGRNTQLEQPSCQPALGWSLLPSYRMPLPADCYYIPKIATMHFFWGSWASAGLRSRPQVSVYRIMDIDMWCGPWALWHLVLRGAKLGWFSVISSKRSSPQPAPAALVSASDLLFGHGARRLYEISCPRHRQRRGNKPILSA